jgi:glutaredoxin-dependent peroxiredoxin
MALKVGDKAPDFTLFDTEKKERSLKDWMGKKTVLVFYPGAFTGTCTKEMCAFRDSLAAFNSMNAQVVGISVDSPFANKGFADHNKLTFPILSDYKHEVTKKYDIVQKDFAGLPGHDTSKRSVFVLDANGVVRYAWISDNPGVEPPYDEVKKAVNSF